MTEDTPTPEQNPGDQTPAPEADLPTPEADPVLPEPTGDVEPVNQGYPSQDGPGTEEPPAPESSPSWPPAQGQEFPTPQEDAALREERARRFGAPEADSGDAPSGAPDPFTGDQTRAFAPGESDPFAEADSHVVTPKPAAPFPAAPGTTGQQPVTPSPFPEAAPALAEPSAHYDAFEELDEGPVSRAAAHWWTILITLVFSPVAWYLFTDAGVRMQWTGSQGEPMSIATYTEFGLGLLAVFIYLLAARWSSVGSIIMGSIFLAAGIAFLIFPSEATALLADSQQYFGRLGQFGLNVSQHLLETLDSGRMAVYGLVMIMVGVVSHGARRQGRREERTKIALGG